MSFPCRYDLHKEVVVKDVLIVLMVDMVVDAWVVVGKEIDVVKVVDKDYLIMVEGGGGRLFDEHSCLLWYAPSVRLQSSNLRDNLLISWTILYMVDSRALILPSTAPTLMERLDCLSSSSAIVGVFAEALIPLDADEKRKKTTDAD